MKQEYENEDEIFEKRESRLGGKVVEKIRKYIIPIIAIFVILLIVIAEMVTHCFSNLTDTLPAPRASASPVTSAIFPIRV